MSDNINTHDSYWDCDCDCEAHYIQPKCVRRCPDCGTVCDDERPDSIIGEMLDMNCMSAAAIAHQERLSQDEAKMLSERMPVLFRDSEGVPVA